MKREYKYLFGPVPSRRLGRSLGVDLTPFKTCTIDCVFCQLGHTTNKTLDRKEYVPAADVKAELEDWFKKNEKADYITLSGSGEPTLHEQFGEILQFIRNRNSIPAALLSNGTLFWRPEVREAAKTADIVKLSLSAWDQLSFERINRPHPALKFGDIVDGYRAFRSEYRGKLWIEVFLMQGVNTALQDMEKIAAIVESIRPDEVHLNTSVRPPAEKLAIALKRNEMEALTGLFHPPARVIAEFPPDKSADVAANEETILAMLKRRPCTAQQIAGVFGMHPNEVSKYVGKLLRTDRIRSQTTGNDTYYIVAEHGGTSTATTKYDEFFGRMNDPTASASIKGLCGDEMEFYLVIHNDRIEDITYHTNGCDNTRSCGHAVARRAKGRNVTDALSISAGEIIRSGECETESHRHCAILAVTTFYSAVS